MDMRLNDIKSELRFPKTPADLKTLRKEIGVYILTTLQSFGKFCNKCGRSKNMQEQHTVRKSTDHIHAK